MSEVVSVPSVDSVSNQAAATCWLTCSGAGAQSCSSGRENTFKRIPPAGVNSVSKSLLFILRFIRLGKPKADAKKTGSVWSREFASGTTVTFNAVTNRGKIAWK